MKNKLGAMFLSLSAFLLPALVFAQTNIDCSSYGSGQSVNDLYKFICKLQTIVNAVIPFLIALATLYFIFGVVQYVIANDEEAKKKGRDRIIYGIIGLVVILGMWGLVFIVSNTFGFNSVGAPTPPCVPGVTC